MTRAQLALVLHGHLPYIRHPEHPEFLEEDWLFEAITETYIPLISMMDGLERDGVPYRLTMSLTPTLMSMLRDELLLSRYKRHIDKLIDLAHHEVERTRGDDRFGPIAHMYRDLFERARDLCFTQYGGDLVGGFNKHEQRGGLEIITCAATHGFLPLMIDKKAVRAQILTAVHEHTRQLGRAPRGIWLPECGFFEGLDEVLAEAGLRYFFTDAHGVLHATPRPKYGVYAPIICRSGVAAFGRDLESSKQVWSSEEGYPGDANYREFYRDVGFDLDYEYVRPYLHPDGARTNLGLKYYKITGRSGNKDPYIREWALAKASEHAANFLFNREKQAEWLSGILGEREPIIVAPYDAELFGHWWFEGPTWVEQVLRQCARDHAHSLSLVTASDYLASGVRCQPAMPSMSSWGYKGYAEVWLNSANDWLYRHLHKAAERMGELARRYPAASGLVRRALNQAAREVLLAQSSDWAFIMKTGTHVAYAERRTHEHLGRFLRLYEDIGHECIDSDWLGRVEAHDNVFPEIDYAHYA